MILLNTKTQRDVLLEVAARGKRGGGKIGQLPAKRRRSLASQLRRHSAKRVSVERNLFRLSMRFLKTE